jgi:hypothetical protein
VNLTAQHNLTDAELVKALAGLATSEGIAEPLGHALLKAAACCEPKEPREPAMIELFHRLRSEYNHAVRDLREALRHPPGLEKALHRTPLTKEQLGRIQQAIRDRFQLVAAQMQEDVAPDAGQIERWQSEGWIAPDVTPQSFAMTVRPEDRYVRNAFVFGRLQQALEAGTGYDEILHLALTLPLRAPDRYAIAIAETQTANYITALGDDLAKEAGAILARQARETIRQMAVDFHSQKLQAKVLDVEAKQALGFSTESRTVDTWQGFKSELYHAFDDKARDWDRVAYFELQDAKGQGVAMAIIEESGPKRLVYRMPLPTACPQCKFLFLEEDGTPRLFPAEQLLGNCNNIGRKPYPVKGGVVIEGIRPDGAEGYQPVSGQVHCWCSCSNIRPYTGYEPWAMVKRGGKPKEPIAKAHGKEQKRTAVGRVLHHALLRKS